MNLPFWPFYVGDYLADTMHLTTAEHGAYLLLMMAYWKRQAPLPDNNADLAQIARLSLSDWEATRSRVAVFFKIEAGKWFHGRLESDIERQKKKYLAQSQAANRTNSKRWPQSLSDTLTESLSVSQPEPEPEPVQSTLTPIVPMEPSEGRDGGNGKWHPTPTQKRFNALFKRRDATAWSPKEVRALKLLGEIPEADMTLIETYYTGYHPTGKDFRRRDLLTLLNNFRGEVDRARKYKPFTGM